MNQYNEISTLQYMGSKARIISHICDPIMKNKSIQTVVDLFAGTGSVGYALKSYKNVISNDIEYYAYIINQAILNGCNFSELSSISESAGNSVCFQHFHSIIFRIGLPAIYRSDRFFVS